MGESGPERRYTQCKRGSHSNVSLPYITSFAPRSLERRQRKGLSPLPLSKGL